MQTSRDGSDRGPRPHPPPVSAHRDRHGGVGAADRLRRRPGRPERPEAEPEDAPPDRARDQGSLAQDGDATEESANITLRSGSKKVGSLSFRECSGEAISFLDCEGKGTPSGLGSGLDVRATWKCSVTGTGCCASVSEGFFFAKTGSPVATLRI